MTRGRCFLCKRQDSQRLRMSGVKFYYMIDFTKSGRVRRKYFCSDCEDTRASEIEAAYQDAEKRKNGTIPYGKP